MKAENKTEYDVPQSRSTAGLGNLCDRWYARVEILRELGDESILARNILMSCIADLREVESEFDEAVTALPQAVRNEREQCAKVCEEDIQRYSNTVQTNGGYWFGKRDWDECAAAIRARSKVPNA